MGESELLVLLSILRREEDAFANRVREDVEERTGAGGRRPERSRALPQLINP